MNNLSNSSAGFQLLKATLLIEKGMLSEALVIIENLLKSEEERAEAHNLLGLIRQKEERFECALHSFERACKLAPSQAAFWVNKAVALKELGDKPLAIEALERALKENPGEELAHKLLIQLYKEQGLASKEEWHYQQLDQLYAEKLNKNIPQALLQEEKATLEAAFIQEQVELLEEFERKLLFKGMFAADEKTASFKTASWDHYFEDLSFGRYRTTATRTRHRWSGRTWHFLFKHLSFVEQLLSNEKKKIHILDIGCSTGYLRKFIEGNVDFTSDSQLFYWGVDLRKDVLKAAIYDKQLIESSSCSNFTPTAYLWHDINYPLPFKESFFDYIIHFETLKYMPISSARNHLAQLQRFLTPEGRLYLSHSLDKAPKDYMITVPFEQLETMLEEASFKIERHYGSQAFFDELQSAVTEEHRPLFQQLLLYHPKEVVAAMIAPFYPQVCEQRTYCCKLS